MLTSENHPRSHKNMQTREKYPRTYHNLLTRQKYLRHWQVVNKMMIPGARTSRRIKQNETNPSVLFPSLPAFGKSFVPTVSDTTVRYRARH